MINIKNLMAACLIFLIFIFASAYSIPANFAEKNVNLDFRKANIRDILHSFAKLLNMNIIISDSINGYTSFHLQNLKSIDALDSMLLVHGYKKWKIEDIWYIGTSQEYIEYKKNKNLIVDKADAFETKIWQINYANVSEVSEVIRGKQNTFLSKNGFIAVDSRTNILCILDYKSNINAIDKLIKRIDIPLKQILIKAQIASIDSDYEKNLGVSFSLGRSKDGNNSHLEANESKYRIAIVSLINGKDLDIELSALEREGHGEIISSPSLVTTNQKTAIIEAGEEIPYQESSSSGATSITFKKATLSLKVTPQIMPDNNILMQIKVNQDKPNKRIVMGVPAISTRQITTNVKIKSGETLVLGGIYESSSEHDQKKVPFLSRIPIIGWFFKDTDFSNRKRELLVFVTPKIVD